MDALPICVLVTECHLGEDRHRMIMASVVMYNEDFADGLVLGDVNRPRGVTRILLNLALNLHAIDDMSMS